MKLNSKITNGTCKAECHGILSILITQTSQGELLNFDTLLHVESMLQILHSQCHIYAVDSFALPESTWLSAIEKQKLTPVSPSFSHKLHYFLDYYNYLDASAVIFTLLIIPTRVAGSDVQWIFAALSYLFNGLRAFKYAAVFRWVIIHSANLT